ncbi:site-specific DNA-methyltransferase [Staphylococcus haemolyticus]|uniref:site-specific DNA-methyltransferase n=1 Tax=Staphylococcus haemolyticus TaxID=1283 RepID=UPI002ACDFEFF|nr:site-specific DNA-methyltransferase [Staphylococcus haemolyticus]
MNSNPQKINLSNYNSRKIDINLLNELHELFTASENQKERYDFTWNGKAKAYFEAAIPTTKTLRVQQDESMNFTNTNNMFITGDNLETLKLLQESYLHKIDMIYIDPPYNTGNDFIYKDNFTKSKRESDINEGKVDAEGNRFVKNDKSNGRYHSDWLTMMYPRLKLARNLLSDTGVIFVSIDDKEQANLKLLMDEIFGEDNFIENYLWESVFRPDNSSPLTRKNAEFIFLYSKNKANIDYLIGTTEQSNGLPSLTKNSMKPTTLSFDANVVETYLENGNYKAGEKSSGYVLHNDIEVLNGIIITPFKLTGRMIWGQDYLEEELNKGTKIVIKGTSFVPYSKKQTTTSAPNKLIPNNLVSDVLNGRTEVASIFDGKQVFSYPKPTSLISYLISIIDKKDALILDFFAGSGTTAEAIMMQNKKDGGQRRYIMATLDEDLDKALSKSDNKAKVSLKNAISFLDKHDLPHTLDYITRERIRRASYKLGDTNGFRALKVDKSGLREDIFKTSSDLIQEDLLSDIDNQSDNRSNYDLLYDVLIDSALEFNKKIEHGSINGEDIIKYDYSSEMTGVIAYFDNNLTDKLIQKIAKLKPLIAVFKESTFNKSAQKVNVLEQFRIISPDTKVKVI